MSDWLPVRDPRFDDAPPAFRAAVSLQAAYWRPDPAALAALAGRFHSLAWGERLRLHHLLCMQIVDAGYDGLRPHRDLFQELLGLLLSPKSPWRPRSAAIWQGAPSVSDPRPPTLQGLLSNASLTHLGAVEMIHLDASQSPTALDFVPFDELLSLVAAGQSLFRAARVFTLGATGGPTVWLPLLYGTSWCSPEPTDRDGSMTRFDHLPDDVPSPVRGVGFGHQDLQLFDPEHGRLLGIGGVGEIMMALEISDPRFDAKCRARGVDPAAARAKYGR